jgi:hypothetical protein
LHPWDSLIPLSLIWHPFYSDHLTHHPGNKVVKLADLAYTPPGFKEPIIRDFTYEFAPGG